MGVKIHGCTTARGGRVVHHSYLNGKIYAFVHLVNVLFLKMHSSKGLSFIFSDNALNNNTHK